MGVVYKARHLALDRVVALKMILAAGHAGPEERRRFRTEAEAVARLDHPNVVRVHDVGEHEGVAFLSLEFCPGGSLERKLAGTPQSPADAARLVETLARAVDHAHCQGVVHRDLKPGNVLLAADGTPKVTDFGLAKKVDAAAQTATGAILGTPSYMAPEQAGGKRVGPPADVYALGAILYECLTGRPPFRAATPLDTVLQVIGEDPVSPRQLQPKLSPDLETVCLKCLHKDPKKRYASAADLADDLRRFLDGKPVYARRAGWAERTAKWVRRHPAAAAVLAVGAVALVVLAVLAWQLNEARQRADREAAAAGAQLDRTQRTFLNAQLWRVASTWRDDPGGALELLDDSDVCRHPFRDFSWGVFYRAAQDRRAQQPRSTLESTSVDADGRRGVSSVAASADGRLVAAATTDRTSAVVHVWETATGRRILTVSPPNWASLVRFRPDGETLVTAPAASPAANAEVPDFALTKVVLWDVRTGRQRLAYPGSVRGRVALSPDGRWGSDDGERVWDTDQGPGDSLHVDAGRVALGDDGRLRVRPVSDPQGDFLEVTGSAGPGRLAAAEVPGPADDLALSPDGRLFASRHGDTLAVWSLAAGKLLFTAKGITGAPAFTPDGKSVAAPARDHSIRLWDVASGQERPPLTGHGADVTTLAFAADGRTLVSGARNGEVKAWTVADPPARLTFHSGRLAVAFSGDGRLLATGGADDEGRLWDPDTGALVRTLGHGQPARFLAFTPDGARLLSSPRPLDSQPTLTLRPVATGEPVPYGGPQVGNSAAVSANGRFLAVVSGPAGECAVFDLVRGKQRARLSNYPGPAVLKAVSPDGGTVVSFMHAEVRVWDLFGDRERFRTTGTGVALFSPDGQRLVLEGPLGTLTVAETATGRTVATLAGATAPLAFSPDGRWLAAVDDDPQNAAVGAVPAEAREEAVSLWEAATGAKAAKLAGHRRPVTCLAFSPDGRTVAAGDDGGRLLCWEAASGDRLADFPRPVGPLGPVTVVAFSPDGRWLAAAHEQLVRLWDAPAGPKR
jgi:WD40 repeat protein